MRILFLLLPMLVAACGGSSPSANSPGIADPVPPQLRGNCAAGAPTLMTGEAVGEDEAKQYFLIPFEVDSGTRRIEVGYGWMDQAITPNPNPFDSTTFDLGLWDERGFRSAEGFRGWSGSREGRIDQGDEPVWVEAGSAARGYIPGSINPGLWYLEIGAGAIKTGGSAWYAEINCLGTDSGATFTADPLDKSFTATQNNPPYPGWYHGDFHMHGFHSNSDGVKAPEIISNAREVGLDVLFYTEYVVPQHWNELGAIQAANDDVFIYPGREIITYFGHINTIGETPDTIDYRHGLEDVTLGDIQRDSVTAGALIQINHPTTFEGPAFENFCRGCAFELGDSIDFNLVDAIEVQNGPTETTAASLGISGPPGAMENPFSGTAIDYWEARLTEGFKITATSGSDSRGQDSNTPGRSGHGSSSTALCANVDGSPAGSISRASVAAAIKSGCAVIKTYGTHHSPHVEMITTGPAGDEVSYGGSIAVGSTETAIMDLTISNAANQVLYMIQNGTEIATPVTCNSVPLTSPVVLASNEVNCSATLSRAVNGDGPLGTFWRFDIKQRDPASTIAPVEIRTIIANPVFLTD